MYRRKKDRLRELQRKYDNVRRLIQYYTDKLVKLLTRDVLSEYFTVYLKVRNLQFSMYSFMQMYNTGRIYDITRHTELYRVRLYIPEKLDVIIVTGEVYVERRIEALEAKVPLTFLSIVNLAEVPIRAKFRGALNNDVVEFEVEAKPATLLEKLNMDRHDIAINADVKHVETAPQDEKPVIEARTRRLAVSKTLDCRQILNKLRTLIAEKEKLKEKLDELEEKLYSPKEGSEYMYSLLEDIADKFSRGDESAELIASKLEDELSHMYGE